MVHRYLSKSAFAARIGVKPNSLNRLKLPPPDAEIIIARKDGKTAIERVYLETTVDEWQARRPGRRPRKGQELWYLDPATQEAARGPDVDESRSNVPAIQARNHVGEIRATGKMTVQQIADAGGVSKSVVERLLYGTAQPTLRSDIAAQLLAVPMPEKD